MSLLVNECQPSRSFRRVGTVIIASRFYKKWGPTIYGIKNYVLLHFSLMVLFACFKLKNNSFKMYDCQYALNGVDLELK